jgi:hypothetical protein
MLGLMTWVNYTEFQPRSGGDILSSGSRAGWWATPGRSGSLLSPPRQTPRQTPPANRRLANLPPTEASAPAQLASLADVPDGVEVPAAAPLADLDTCWGPGRHWSSQQLPAAAPVAPATSVHTDPHRP